MKLVHGSLFSGFDAPSVAASWMGWENAFHCEINDFCNEILKYWFPNSEHYEDITKTDFSQWRGRIDILTGGFPCQPFSVAGQRKGADDNRYLWTHMLRAIREIRPTWVIGENVAGILTMVQPGEETEMGSQTSLFEENDKETILEQEYVVETVCRSIEQEGYSVQPIVIPACSVEAPHIRYKVFFIAHCPDAGVESVQREGKREWIRYDTERISEERNASDPKCKGSGQIQQKIQSKQPNGNSADSISDKRNVTNAKANSWKTPCEHGDGAPDLQTYIANATGEISRLNPLFVEEMMGFPLMWTTLPFLSQSGDRNQSRDMETP